MMTTTVVVMMMMTTTTLSLRRFHHRHDDIDFICTFELFTCAHACIRTSISTYRHTHVNIYMWVCMLVCMYLHMCMDIYIYHIICICIHIHVCVTYAYLHYVCDAQLHAITSVHTMSVIRSVCVSLKLNTPKISTFFLYVLRGI